jgi:MFS family permease
MLKGRLTDLFSISGFRRVWLSGSLGWFGVTVTQLALGWLAVQLTDSALAVGAVLAATAVGLLVFGIPAGSLADRMDRRRLILVTFVAGASAAAIMAIAVAGTTPSLVLLLAFAFAIGSIDALRFTATQAYVFDIVGSARATSGLALTNLGAQLFGVAGGLIGGLAVETSGAAAALALVAVIWSAAALVVLRLPQARPHAREQPGGVSGRPRDGFGLLLRNRAVALIAGVVVLAEVLGFSTGTLYPSFARDVLEAGPSALGVMLAAWSAGGVAGLVILTVRRWRAREGAQLLLALAILGGCFVLVAPSTSLLIVALLIAVAGAAGAGLDTLAQSLLQKSVADTERGAATGVWVVSVGLGPIGLLAMGAWADVAGEAIVFLAAGLVLLLAAVLLAVLSPLRFLPPTGDRGESVPPASDDAVSLAPDR